MTRRTLTASPVRSVRVATDPGLAGDGLGVADPADRAGPLMVRTSVIAPAVIWAMGSSQVASVWVGVDTPSR